MSWALTGSKQTEYPCSPSNQVCAVGQKPQVCGAVVQISYLYLRQSAQWAVYGQRNQPHQKCYLGPGRRADLHHGISHQILPLQWHVGRCLIISTRMFFFSWYFVAIEIRFQVCFSFFASRFICSCYAHQVTMVSFELWMFQFTWPPSTATHWVAWTGIFILQISVAWAVTEHSLILFYCCLFCVCVDSLILSGSSRHGIFRSIVPNICSSSRFCIIGMEMRWKSCKRKS